MGWVAQLHWLILNSHLRNWDHRCAAPTWLLQRSHCIHYFVVWNISEPVEHIYKIAMMWTHTKPLQTEGTHLRLHYPLLIPILQMCHKAFGGVGSAVRSDGEGQRWICGPVPVRWRWPGYPQDSVPPAETVPLHRGQLWGKGEQNTKMAWTCHESSHARKEGCWNFRQQENGLNALCIYKHVFMSICLCLSDGSVCFFALLRTPWWVHISYKNKWWEDHHISYFTLDLIVAF